MSRVIQICCYRLGAWEQKSSADLVETITAPVSFTPLWMTDAFKLALEAGLTITDLAGIFDPTKVTDGYERILRSSLYEGNLTSALAMIQIGQERGILSQKAADVFTAIITKRTKRMVDVVAAELNEVVPEKIDIESVEKALK